MHFSILHKMLWKAFGYLEKPRICKVSKGKWKILDIKGNKKYMEKIYCFLTRKKVSVCIKALNTTFCIMNTVPLIAQLIQSNIWGKLSLYHNLWQYPNMDTGKQHHILSCTIVSKGSQHLLRNKKENCRINIKTWSKIVRRNIKTFTFKILLQPAEQGNKCKFIKTVNNFYHSKY